MSGSENSIATLEMSVARQEFADSVNRVAYRKERIILRRHGKDLVALVPLEDLALLEELEDRLDSEEARAALAESGERLPYDQVRRDLGLVPEDS